MIGGGEGGVVQGQILTPRHRLRQLELSLFFKGQTTSLLASVTEKELVSELRGGMVHMFHPKDKKKEGRIKRSAKHRQGVYVNNRQKCSSTCSG